MERNQKLGLQFKRMESHCGFDLLLTTEGLYLAPVTNSLPIFESFESFADTRGIIDLELADSDYKSLEFIEYEKLVLQRECEIFVNTLKLFTFTEDQFLRINDFKGNEQILYSLGGQIYKPKCIKISTIRTIKLPTCFKDFPIQFYLNKFFENGFLTPERIIKAHSKKADCIKMPRYIHIPATKQTLVGYANDIILWETKDISIQKFDFYDEVTYKNYTHVDGLVNGVDIIGQIHNLSVTTENGQQWLVIADENSKSEGFVAACALASF